MKFVPAPIIADEVWKPVMGFVGLYEVSDHGRVRRVHHKRGTEIGWVLKHHPDKDQYPYVDLRKLDGTRIGMQRIHKLVMAAFVGPRPDGMTVDHVDGVKSNNKLTNLEYVTARENLDRKFRAGRCAKGEGHGFSKFTVAQVLLFRRLVELGYVQKDIAKVFGISVSGLSGIITRKNWTHV